MYKALNIASAVLSICDEQDVGITNLKLQKILYFIQSGFIKGKGKMCFSDRIEAWPYGPVVPTVYWAFSKYMASPILSWNTSTESILKEDKELICSIVKRYIDMDAWDLVKLTHKEEPWIRAIKKGNKTEITQQSMQMYYKGQQNE